MRDDGSSVAPPALCVRALGYAMRWIVAGFHLDYMSSDFNAAFDARWLAEAVRLREVSRGRLEDAAALAMARSEAVGLEPRIVARAAHLGERTGLSQALAEWRGRVGLAALALLLLAALGGVGAGLAVAGDGLRPINVVWALGGLLGLHLVMLALWALGFVFAGSAPAGLGASWNWLAVRMAAGSVEVPRAFAALHRHAGLLRWWLGCATHAVWSAALGGALVGLAASFLLRNHVFVWETTLLSSGFFIDFVAVAGWLPSLLGFAVPDADMVAASGATPLTDEAARRAWAWWLVGCVLVYGWLPRVGLWAFCAWRLKRGRAAVRLDLALPGFSELAKALAPASERIGVTDAAPHSIAVARVDDPHAFDGPPALAGIELRGDRHWPPALPAGARDLGVADSREQRARLQAALAEQPARRLLIACDGRLSPDRGSLSLVAQWSHHAGRCAVWLVDASGDRMERWREALTEIRMDSAAILQDEQAALNWLVAEEDARHV